jgi:hypothetical protein
MVDTDKTSTPASASGSATSSPSGNPFTDAATRIRNSAKYLLGAFAAVGALLAAGLQLTSLGKLSSDRPDHRSQLAALGVALTVLGIALAVGSASVVISRSFVTLSWLAEKDRRHRNVDRDKPLLAGLDVRTLYEFHLDVLES